MDAARQLAQLVERLRELGARRSSPAPRRPRDRGGCRPGSAAAAARSRPAAAARRRAGRARAGGARRRPAATTLPRGLRLVVSSWCLERDRCRCRDGLDQVRVLVERAVVDERRRRRTPAHRTAGARRQATGSPSASAYAPGARRPRRGSGRRGPAPAAPAARRRAACAARRRARSAAACQPRAQQAREEDRRHEQERGEHEPHQRIPGRRGCASAAKNSAEIPATLGSIARRRGADARLNRAPITTAVPGTRRR